MSANKRLNPASFIPTSTMGSLDPSTTASRPSFDALPLREGDPKASAWGLWGDNDELGTLNLLTASLVKEAASEVLTGETIPLK